MKPLPDDAVCAFCIDGDCNDDACPYAAHEPEDAEEALQALFVAIGYRPGRGSDRDA